MNPYQSGAKGVDEYLAGFPPEVQEILQRIRAIVREAAPEATETIAYQIPTFRLKGNLVHFAAYKHHIALYPVPPASDELNQVMSAYRTGKGTLQFPLDKPMPYDLIAQIVGLLVAENLRRAEEKTERRY